MRDYECEEPVLEVTAMQTGQQIETREDQPQEAVSSMVVAWCTHHQGLKRLFRCRAQSRKHMQLLQPSWMQFSSG